MPVTRNERLSSIILLLVVPYLISGISILWFIVASEVHPIETGPKGSTEFHMSLWFGMGLVLLSIPTAAILAGLSYTAKTTNGIQIWIILGLVGSASYAYLLCIYYLNALQAEYTVGTTPVNLAFLGIGLILPTVLIAWGGWLGFKKTNPQQAVSYPEPDALESNK